MGRISEVKTIAGRSGPRREHAHDEHSVALVWKGAAKALVRGSPREATAGQAVLIAAGTPHECSPLRFEEWDYTLLLVRPGADSKLDEILAEADDGMLVLDVPSAFASSLAIAAEGGRDNSAIIALDALLARIAAPRNAARASATGESSFPAGLELAAEKLRSSIEEGASIDELAELAGMGKYRFARAFKSAFGLSPHAYLLNLRVNEAKSLLRGGKSLVDTALACGFCDQSHFGRVFERTVGLSPAAYARGALRRNGARTYKTGDGDMA
jgi:AraC-like DNA-binding protein